MGKAGRKPNFFRDSDGREIRGLYVEKTSRQTAEGKQLQRLYSRDEKGDRVFHGNDYDADSCRAAIFAFRQWERTQSAPQAITIESDPVVKLDGKLAKIERTIRHHGTAKKPPGIEAVILPPGLTILPDSKIELTGGDSYVIPESLYVAKVRDDLTNRLDWLASATGFAMLTRLASLPKLDPGPKLDDLLDSYLSYVDARQKLTGPRERTKITAWWNDFAKLTGAATASEITETSIDRYLKATAGQGSRKNRHISIAAILRHKHKRGSTHPELIRIHGLSAMLDKPPQNGSDPQPISREDFHALMSEGADAAVQQSGLWPACYLTALNLAFYPIDIARFPKSAIDLKTGAVCFDRKKTQTPRVGILWTRTLAALREYWKRNPAANASPLAFVNDAGKAFTTNRFCENFALRRRNAGLPKIEFGHLRDGAQTAAIQGGANPLHADILLGHRAPGIRDAYLRRNPMMVADACRAIEEFYFPAEKSKKGGSK